jgi:hypothetical protein
MELNLNGLHNDAIHVSGFSGEYGGYLKLNAVSQVDDVFSNSRLEHPDKSAEHNLNFG